MPRASPTTHVRPDSDLNEELGVGGTIPRTRQTEKEREWGVRAEV